MIYKLLLFEKYGDTIPEGMIDSGNAPLNYKWFSIDKGTNNYRRFGKPIDWQRIKGRIVVNYYLNINANENTTCNKRPKRV